MKTYVCEGCLYNNNGWCKVKKINGLKQTNRQYCTNYAGLFSKSDAKLQNVSEIIPKVASTFIPENEFPLGIIPKEIWELRRFNALKEAILRYSDANRDIPCEWIKELNSLANVVKIKDV